MKNIKNFTLCLSLLVLVSCQNKEKKVQTSTQQLNKFTNELLGKIKAKPNLKVGLQEARKYLKTHKERIQQHIQITKTTNRVQVSEQTIKAWQAAIANNLNKIEALKNVYIRQALADKALAKELNKLVKEYRDLLEK